MYPNERAVSRPGVSVIATNKLIRNTYTLLAMTLLFSAATAGMSVKYDLPYLGFLPTLLGYFGLLFLTFKLKNSAWGLLAIFALTGFMGLTLGPIVNLYLHMANGPQTVAMAMGGTGIIFVGLSTYALTTRKDFSYLGGFLMVGMLVAFLGMLGAWLFSLPMLSLAVSGMFVLVMSGYILYQTSLLVNGGETNYILATVSLYVSIYNLFVSLLQIIAAFNGNNR